MEIDWIVSSQQSRLLSHPFLHLCAKPEHPGFFQRTMNTQDGTPRLASFSWLVSGWIRLGYIGFMVDITWYNELVFMGIIMVYKPTDITGGPHSASYLPNRACRRGEYIYIIIYIIYIYIIYIYILYTYLGKEWERYIAKKKSCDMDILRHGQHPRRRIVFCLGAGEWTPE